MKFKALLRSVPLIKPCWVCRGCIEMHTNLIVMSQKMNSCDVRKRGRLGILKRWQKCKKSGSLKPPRAPITTNEPIQSKLDYRLDLAVSIDMLV
jgi:hypothetical protein